MGACAGQDANPALASKTSIVAMSTFLLLLAKEFAGIDLCDQVGIPWTGNPFSTIALFTRTACFSLHPKRESGGLGTIRSTEFLALA